LPTWSEILKELSDLRSQGKIPFDIVRRKYLSSLSAYTNRNTILYATSWTTHLGIPVDPNLTSITDEDVEGLMEVIHRLKGDDLDLILHSPGGSAEATEAFVSYLRMKFTDIRVIIPYAAMSAATMLSCAANTIVMGKHSFIGPIDPQIVLQTQSGNQIVAAAQAVLDQFKLAKKECQDPANLNVWYPILGNYGPALIQQCQDAIDLSRTLVSSWLKDYMFSGRHDAEKISHNIADYLSDHTQFKTHARHINRHTAKANGLIIQHLEDDQTFQDLVLSVYHATTNTFTSGTVKIIENHLGKAFVKQIVAVPGLVGQEPGPPSPPVQPPS
jgi:ATP-dependent protease ClpP protease subunit